MTLHIECDRGWAALYEPLIARCREEGVEISQVKEKFGGLRFYTDGTASSELIAAIDAAEALSFTVCEVCGSPGVPRCDGWIRTLCDTHAEGREPYEPNTLRFTRVRVTCRVCEEPIGSLAQLELHQAMRHGPAPREPALWRRAVRATVDWMRGEST